MEAPKRIDHIGIAVRRLDESIPFYTEVLGCRLLGFEEVESEGVKVAMLEIGESRFELLEATRPDSAIAKFIEKKGEGIHHIAVDVAGIESRLAQMKEQGLRLINETPKAGADGNRIAFIHPAATKGVLMELCETSEQEE